MTNNNIIMKTKILFTIVIAFLLAITLGIFTPCQKTNQRLSQPEEFSILGKWYVVGNKLSNDSIIVVRKALQYTFLDDSKYLSIYYPQQLNYNLVAGNIIYMEFTYNTPTEYILTKDTLYLNNHVTVDSSYWSVLTR